MINGNAGKKIGLTGGIGAGKSAVCARLVELGATVISADSASRSVVEPGASGLIALVSRYGKRILLPDGRLNRHALADIIFHDDTERNAVEALLHPLIRAELDANAAVFFAQHPTEPLFLEIPLLIEANMQASVNEIWLVTAPEAQRAARIIERDGCTQEEALLRIHSQIPQEQKLAYAHAVLINEGTLEELHRQVDTLFQAYKVNH